MQLNFKSGIKKGTVTYRPSNVVGDSNYETKFPHILSLTNKKVSKLLKAFINNSSANIKLKKTQLLKIGLSGGFLGMYLGPLPKNYKKYT